MSSFRKHTEETKAALLKIQKENGNECCADCSEQRKFSNVEMTAYCPRAVLKLYCKPGGPLNVDRST